MLKFASAGDIALRLARYTFIIRIIVQCRFKICKYRAVVLEEAPRSVQPACRVCSFSRDFIVEASFFFKFNKTNRIRSHVKLQLPYPFS